MSTAAVNQPVYYSSLFRHGVDEKRRLQIPAKWRPTSEDFQFTLILWPNGEIVGPCMLVLPPEQLLELVTKLKALPFADPQAQRLRRLLGTDSAQVTVDKAGRICLPEEMAAAAGITNEAVLTGLLDRFQIWSPERYAQIDAQDKAFKPEAFKLIS
jgi:MraZ protein